MFHVGRHSEGWHIKYQKLEHLCALLIATSVPNWAPFQTITQNLQIQLFYVGRHYYFMFKKNSENLIELEDLAMGFTYSQLGAISKGEDTKMPNLRFTLGAIALTEINIWKKCSKLKWNGGLRY